MLQGKKTNLTTIALVIVALLPDLQELLSLEGELTTFNFYFPLGKILLGGLIMYFKKIGVDREVKKVKQNM